jgi:hypothetical protein
MNKYPRLYLPRKLYYLLHPVILNWHVSNAEYVYKGKDTPVSLTYTPPNTAQISLVDSAIVSSTLTEWARLARQLGMEPWIVYMPCKRRVLDGYVRFHPNVKKTLINWAPTDLPDFIGKIANRTGMGFVDLTGPLVDETRQGRLTFNSVTDTHLNRHGSVIVAQAIISALKRSRVIR